jgi:2-polyprenyl-3-methyl-5-hydroxy-6-metoxy-1,4-benzoquinol methylase
MSLVTFWNDKVSEPHRHIVGSMGNFKQIDLIRRLNKYVVNDLKKYNVTSVVDWGCGGGLLAKELVEEFKVTVFDISEKSLIECVNYVGKENLSDTFLVPNDLNDLHVNIDIDAIHCSNVIHHFPSFDYWYLVVNFWKNLNPTCITINTKLGEDTESKDYFRGNNYVSGLFLSKATVIDSFSSYNLVNFNTEPTINKEATIAFYTFLKK